MGRVKDFRQFVAEEYVAKGEGLIDLDRGFVLADTLWDKACKKDKKATARLGRLVRKYKKQQEKN